ncbi:hypothetical protein J3E68DRAFT_429908 [Trichoderma sp. SZMC 28012]
MSGSSPRRVSNDNNINNEASAIVNDAQSATKSAEKSDLSYSLMRYLSDENYTLGHRPARSPVESEERVAKELCNFDAQFCSSGGPPHRNQKPMKNCATACKGANP